MLSKAPAKGANVERLRGGGRMDSMANIKKMKSVWKHHNNAWRIQVVRSDL